jgi:hypothetical protein
MSTPASLFRFCALVHASMCLPEQEPNSNERELLYVSLHSNTQRIASSRLGLLASNGPSIFASDGN